MSRSSTRDRGSSPEAGSSSAWREAAGLTQVELAGRIFYARSTLAGAEIGREHLTRTFWQRADRELNAGGALLAGFEDVDALVRGRHHRVTLVQARQRAALAPDGCGCAVVVGRWSSSDVRALREAMRLPVRAFADRLGVHVGTVTAWESPRRSVPIALAAQETLDGALRLADPDVRTRFAQLRAGPETRID
jgi:DNA-binding transcriptional regulator YiaG